MLFGGIGSVAGEMLRSMNTTVLLAIQLATLVTAYRLLFTYPPIRLRNITQDMLEWHAREKSGGAVAQLKSTISPPEKANTIDTSSDHTLYMLTNRWNLRNHSTRIKHNRGQHHLPRL